MEQDIERRLIRKAQRGDKDAALALLMQHNRAMWRIAVHTRSRSEGKEDLYQWACLFFLKAVQDYDLRNPKRVRLSTWTYDHVEKRVRGMAWRHGAIHLPPNASKTDPTATYRAIQQFCGNISENTRELGREHDFADLDDEDEIQWLRDAIARLPPRMQEVMTMHLDGSNGNEVGFVMGVTRERIRQIREDAFCRIRRMRSDEALRRVVQSVR